MLGRKNIKLRREKFYDKKQVYGLKKLSIGTVSVLLGMTFIVFDNHTVSANTTDAVQESESTNSSATSIQKKALTLKTSATSTSDVSTADTTSTSSSATNDATNNETKTTSTATSTAATSTSEESTSSQNNQVVNSTTVEPTNNATMNSTDNLEKIKLHQAFKKKHDELLYQHILQPLQQMLTALLCRLTVQLLVMMAMLERI